MQKVASSGHLELDTASPGCDPVGSKCEFAACHAGYEFKKYQAKGEAGHSADHYAELKPAHSKSSGGCQCHDGYGWVKESEQSLLELDAHFEGKPSPGTLTLSAAPGSDRVLFKFTEREAGVHNCEGQYKVSSGKVLNVQSEYSGEIKREAWLVPLAVLAVVFVLAALATVAVRARDRYVLAAPMDQQPCCSIPASLLRDEKSCPDNILLGSPCVDYPIRFANFDDKLQATYVDLQES